MTWLLGTERLILEPFTEDLIEKTAELAGDPEVAATTFLPHPYTIEHAKEWIASHASWMEEKKAFPFAVKQKKDGGLLGTMTLRIDEAHQKGELAYWIGRPFWGQGYGSEAARRVVRFGLEDIGLHRIWAAAISDNPASTRVMQKAGLTYEGTLKEDMLHGGEFKDIDVYGLVRGSQRRSM
ncbi:GNAT family N-acetyltransferase [Halobacillus kuroshimensis]|uniref:GNAT family N-acetyltransferase n=1 Tax=Halobacillus kuroshimensis TaxID=302481 RepID=A0ABS3DYQ3_9BACI|nr:GNAT family N-acetyltransferase [Halobacillus kuroshimensis]MBN8236482.1 GNAT family N-acetyltransferase [Halobacillus kuroshimensis]